LPWPVALSCGSLVLPRLAGGDRLACPGLHDLGDVIVTETKMLADKRARDQPCCCLRLESRFADLKNSCCLGGGMKLARHSSSASRYDQRVSHSRWAWSCSPGATGSTLKSCRGPGRDRVYDWPFADHLGDTQTGTGSSSMAAGAMAGWRRCNSRQSTPML
jgi:hypothetical protein